eukprot:jgi/Psemu1/303754/fgenesh1_kg.121_\
MYAMIVPNETMLLTSAKSEINRIDERKVNITVTDDETVACSDSDCSSMSLCTSDRNSCKSALKTNTTGRIKKRVAFDVVIIRSYQQTMGDNPGVSYGPPIQLDWDYEEHENIDIDEYEIARGHSRRTMRQMVMNYYQRKSLLKREYGFTEEELKQAKKDVNRVKFLRDVTKSLLPMMKVEDAVESAGRKARRLVGMKK